MNNKQIGNGFEQEFCEELAKQGFWAHNLANRKSGQPFDVIAAKNCNAAVFDCKVCSKDIFTISRVEENQYNAMNLWNECGNSFAYFVFKLPSGQIKLIEFDYIKALIDGGTKQINVSEFGLDFEQWVLYEDTI